MTTEHVSVPRDELESLLRWMLDYVPAGTHAATTMCIRLQNILSRATPSDDDFYCCNGVDCGCQGITKREYAEACSKNPSAPHVVKEPLSVFSGGMWTCNETGQSFTKEEMDEAAFIAYRDHAESFATSLPAARVSDEIRQEARRLLEYYTDSSLAPYVEDLPHSGVEKFLERLAK